MKLIPFEPVHITAIDLQDDQAGDDPYTKFNIGYGQYLHDSGAAVTGIVGDTVVFCIGKVEIWKNRHMVWALVSKSARNHMVTITKAIKRLMKLYRGDGRFEVVVRADFEQGHRWVRMFGFVKYTLEEKYLPNGTDARVYVRFL